MKHLLSSIRDHFYPPVPIFTPKYYERYRRLQFSILAGGVLNIIGGFLPAGNPSFALSAAGMLVIGTGFAVLLPMWRIQARKELSA